LKGKIEAIDELLDMMDKAELMIDLAYSSLIYDNIEIAKEVAELEDLVDQKNRSIQRLAVEDLLEGDLAVNEALTIIRLSQSTEMIADAAMEIADVELRDIELHPIIKDAIRESDVVFTRAQVSPKSILAGKTLGELELASETGMWVIAMRDAARWLYGPNEDTRVDPGDILYVRGPADSEEGFMKLASGEKREF